MKKFHTMYSHANPVSPHGGVSMTDQQYIKDCDINIILKQYGATGRLPVNIREGVSGDFSDIGDYKDCLDRINNAKDSFCALPSHIRDRFGNDPTAYVEFVLDPSNTDECIRLGLKVKPDPQPEKEIDVLKRIEQALVTPQGNKLAQ